MSLDRHILISETTPTLFLRKAKAAEFNTKWFLNSALGLDHDKSVNMFDWVSEVI